MPDPTPNPPRFRWLKRLAIGALVAVLSLALLRGYWGHREKAELDKLVEDARAKGYPVLFEDIQPANIPSHENRAAYVQQAINAIPAVNTQGQSVTETDWFMEGGADYFEEHRLSDPVPDNAAYLSQFQPVIDAMRQAGQCPRSDWSMGAGFTRPLINMAITGLSDARHLARVMEDAIDRAVAAEDYALAVEMLGQLITLAASLRDEPCTLIDHLVGISIRALAADAVQRVLPRLPDDPALAGPLAELNARWLDEAWAAEGLAESLKTELWMVYELAEGMVDGRHNFGQAWGGGSITHLAPLDYAPSRWLLRPYYQDDLGFIVRYFTRQIDAADGCTNHEQYTDRLGPEFAEMQRQLEGAALVWPVRRPISCELLWSVDTVGRTHFRAFAMTRMCAAAIAIKRFAIDHGRRPDTLAQLVPDYLPAVPDDPFVLGRKVTYLPEGVSPTLRDVGTAMGRVGSHYGISQPLDPEVALRAQQTYPLLYCIGDDRTDDGGLFPINEYSGVIDNFFTGSDTPTDRCFFLDALPRPIPDPHVLPFHQRSYNQGLGGPGLTPPSPNNPAPAGGPVSPGEEEQVDEADDGGQDEEDQDAPAQPEQGQP